jgi:predicted alpha/beta-hydrolase family hydrolase
MLEHDYPDGPRHSRLLATVLRSDRHNLASTAVQTNRRPAVRGLAFLGFPLHPAEKPSAERAKHVFEVLVPLLFDSSTDT